MPANLPATLNQRSIMNVRIVLATVAVATLSTIGCGPNPKSGRGFVMPAGNAEKGKAAFVQLKCTDCHTVDRVDLPAPATPVRMNVVLGGDVTRIRTYGELVTAIIHPPRNISEKLTHEPGKSPTASPMKDVNHEMTVAQMVDIVTFLQPTYRQLPPVLEPSMP